MRRPLAPILGTVLALTCWTSPCRAAAATTPRPWITRHAPTRHTVELGVGFGPFFPPSHHGLVDDAINADSGGSFFQKYRRVALAFDLRAAYFPLRVLGVELGGGFAPTYTRPHDERADLFQFGGHLIAQLPRWSATPFVLAGGGLLGTRGALGSDLDPAMSLGVGGKLFLNDRLVLRVDLRDTLARGLGRAFVHYVQFTIGVSLSFRRQRT